MHIAAGKKAFQAYWLSRQKTAKGIPVGSAEFISLERDGLPFAYDPSLPDDAEIVAEKQQPMDKVLWTDHMVVSARGYDGRIISRKEFEPKPVTLGDIEDAIKKVESILDDSE